ncbi:MAG: SET domain-containing protein [Rhodospirillales bacterium]
MMLVKNYVAPSAIQGVGVFAGERIPKGTRIYEFVEGVDIVMTREQTAAYGPEFARFMHIFAYVDPGDRTMVISVDNSRFMNHADQPNTDWDQIFGWATQDIEIGEEITCDYYSFWFEPPFADPSK